MYLAESTIRDGPSDVAAITRKIYSNFRIVAASQECGIFFEL